MTVAVVALAITLASALGLIAWLAKVALDSRAASSDSRFDLALRTAELERASFETEATGKALDAAVARAATLEKELAHALEQISLGVGLPADDVATRLRRLGARWRVDGEGAGDPVRPDAGGPVSDDPTTDPARARREP